jgi:poly(3-hydroxybutyrate) depolymerase
MLCARPEAPAPEIALHRLMLILACCALPACSDGAGEPLPQLPILPGSVTVSGISAGGFMAGQYHVAYGDEVGGAGILAAGPWYCAEGSMSRALGPCMKAEDGAPDGAALLEQARAAAGRGQVAPLESLAEDRVWVFHGERDATVVRAVSDALVAFYQGIVVPDRLEYVTAVPAVHGFPTLDEGLACDEAGDPYLNDCDYDAAGELLRHLYGDLAPRGRANPRNLVAFDQRRYETPGASLEPLGYAYIPAACRAGQPCRLHIAFHGCRQGTSFVGRAFIMNAGYNEWAEANGIVVLYPQVQRSFAMPLNPQGCWDWWGYTGADYAFRDGAQLASVRQMAQALGAN